MPIEAVVCRTRRPVLRHRAGRRRRHRTRPLHLRPPTAPTTHRTAVNGALPANPYRYASGRAIATNATNQVVLYQYGQRFYQRSTGRWTQQDNLEHLGDPTQGNRYVYVGGAPSTESIRQGGMGVQLRIRDHFLGI